MKSYILLFLFLFKLSYVSAASLSMVEERIFSHHQKIVKPNKSLAADCNLIQRLKNFKSNSKALQRKFIRADIIGNNIYVFYSITQLNMILKYDCEFTDIDNKRGFLAEISCFHNMNDALRCNASIIGHISFRRENDNEAYISYIEVDDSFRSHGLGTIIFEQALRFIENENMCDQIRLIVMHGTANLAAVKMYEKHGFRWKYPHTHESAEMIKEIKPKSKL